MKRHLFAGLALVPVLLAACEIPTDAPIWDMTWNVPIKSSTISVSSFLPSGVTVGTNNTFQFTVAPVVITRTLGQDCAACAAANGLTVPKPAFTGGGSGSASLPSGVTSAVLVNDTLTVTINNGFNFDPINPAGAASEGFMILAVTSGATSIGRDSVPSRGPTAVSIPAGGTLTRRIPLAGTASSAGISVAVTLNSPAGNPVQMDANRTITFTASAGTVRISSARVSLSNTSVNSTSTIDLADIDSSVVKRVNSATLLLTITNPFAAGGNLTINFAGGSQPVSKTLTLDQGGPSAPPSTKSITLTGAEIRALLGHSITMTFTGAVTGTAVDVTPALSVNAAARMQLNVSTEAQ